MDTLRTRPAPVAALVLAGAALLLLTIADLVWTSTTADESASVPLFVLGWVLLAWALIVGVVGVVGLLRRPSGRETALLAATTALVVLTCTLHPLVGSGAG